MTPSDAHAILQIARDSRIVDLVADGYRIHSTLSGWTVMRHHGPGGRVLDFVGSRPQITEAVGLAARHRAEPRIIDRREAWRAANEHRRFIASPPE